MLKVIFECDKCGHKNGKIITHVNTTEVECENCLTWETMDEETTRR